MASGQTDDATSGPARVLHPRWVARHWPNRPALIMAETGETLSYAALVQNADRLSGLFVELGLQAADTVALLMENSTAFVEMVWAAKNSGLFYVPLNTHLNALDLAYVVENAGARLMIVSAELAPLAQAALRRLAAPPSVFVLGGDSGLPDLAERLRSVQTPPPSGRLRGRSMLYSSGTTGRPKAVRPHLDSASPQESTPRHAEMVRLLDLSADSIFLNPAPFYHAAPLRLMTMLHREGGTAVGFGRFNPALVVEALQRYAATGGFFVPTMFSRLLALPEDVRRRTSAQSLRCVVHGAAPCTVGVKRAMIDWWGEVIVELYGGTEGLGQTVIGARDWLAHPGSVGRATAGCDIRIVDAGGRSLPPGERGRVMMRNGRRISYHGNEEATASLYTADGFASLGDIGYLDQAGFLYLTDRESHMIISGGVNVYPQEAEHVLAEHPAVADVAVIGVPDPDLGEVALALIQPRGTVEDAVVLTEELMTFCRAHLSLYKCPRRITFVAQLPRTELGKIAKHVLKQPYWPQKS